MSSTLGPTPDASGPGEPSKLSREPASHSPSEVTLHGEHVHRGSETIELTEVHAIKSDEAHRDFEKTAIRIDEIVALASPSHPSSTATFAPMPSPPVHELVGQSLDHYRIESLVGVGGMGAVFRGRDQRLDRVVAIKVVPMAHRRADAMRRFRMEAQSAAKLDHPNIARVYYVGETERWSYIVFEFIEGTNLRQLVLEHGLLTVEDATNFTCQVAEALQHAHERGVVHRDIKPSNILIGTDGKAKLVDMGLARTTELDRSTGDLTASGVTLGTFDYISPEQAHDPRDADVRSDIYSLGCTLYFLLTGQPPFPDGTALQKLLMHGTKMPEDPRFFRNDLSDALIAILRKMMAKKPRDRYQEPADLVNDLRMLAVIDSLPWGQSAPGETVAIPGSTRPWWETALPSIVCLIVISMVTLWLYNANQLNAVYPIPRVEWNEVAASESPNADAQSTGSESPDANASVARMLDTPANADTARDAASSLSNRSGPPAAPQRSAPSPNLPSATRVKTLVVSSESPAPRSYLQAPHDVVNTWDEAVDRAMADKQIDRIVLDADSLVVQRPIEWLRSVDQPPLVIESAPGRRCNLSFDESGWKATAVESSAWIALEGGNCTFQGIDMEWTAMMDEGRPQSVFQVAGGAKAAFIACTVSIKHAGVVPLPSFLQLGVRPTENPPSTTIASVSLDRTAIRGQVDCIRMTNTEKVDVSMRQCWVVVAGSTLLANGASTLNRSPRVRLEIDHSTFFTLAPWARIRMSMTQPFPIAMVRVANESIFSGSNTLIEWDASNCTDWTFAAQAKKVEDLGRWIDLRGLDNAYDVPTIVKLVQVLMSMSSEEVPIDSDTNLLRNERGMELQAAWQPQVRLESSKMHLHTPKLFQWNHGVFQTGCDVQQLPSFPGSNANTGSNANAGTPSAALSGPQSDRP